ncbi:hypothetical protein ABT009_27270 [Streptomyces sp. NPDC002896]|uniref:hypothetical protein n=1 Tax=Streptomyces sp. NPDC002896 TaxID=3154438 RepID=UPI00333462D7
MRITEETLTSAWHRKAAGSELLDDAMLPPIVAAGDYDHASPGLEPEELYIELADDGTVRGSNGDEEELFDSDDLDLVLYFIAEEVTRTLARQDSDAGASSGRGAGAVVRQAELLDHIDAAWGRRFRSGGTDDTGTVEPCGTDPIDGFAWVSGGWREQAPYTHLAFYRGENVKPEEIALFHSADPDDVAAGVRLSDLPALLAQGRNPGSSLDWQTFCYGQAGEWAYLLYHDTPPRGCSDKERKEQEERYNRLGITESVWLSACSAKAIYTFDYMRDGVCVADDVLSALELISYDLGRAPYRRGGQLDFLNRAIRRAELDHPEVTDEFQLYFHALETALGLGLPRTDIEQGTARAARWAPRDT